MKTLTTKHHQWTMVSVDIDSQDLDNWNGGTADGPIEATGNAANFVWVIYHVEPPLVNNAGNVQTKFGH